jgi:tetratricopeptide (TPR) repeat protein
MPSEHTLTPGQPPPARAALREAVSPVLSKVGGWVGRFFIVAAVLALFLAIFYFTQKWQLLTAMPATLLVFVLGVGIIAAVSGVWLRRIDDHPLLRSDEKLQNKDALVIATAALLALHLGLCVVSSGAAMLFPSHGLAAAFLALNSSLAAVAVGGAFGFLLGHPRRLPEEDAAKDGRTGSGWLLKTGLDDIVDWLVKGITTVLLVESRKVLEKLHPLAETLGNALAGYSPADGGASGPAADGYAFALALIVYFTLFGTGATCLVTRTYLTGALGRADRSTVNAFSRVGLHWGEILTFVGAQRFLGSRDGAVSAELLAVARKLAALSLNDLRTPQEYALWAKAKSALGESALALRGYEKAILQCDCDPALLLDYAVALSGAKQYDGVLARLEQARLQISEGTPDEVRKNIYKSLTYALLFRPARYDQVLALVAQYFARPQAAPSAGLRVNEACACGQKFYAEALGHGLLHRRDTDGVLCIVPVAPAAWPTESLRASFTRALQAVDDAMQRNPAWKARFVTLLDPGATDKSAGDNDLEVFAAFPEFRTRLDLAPLPESPATPVAAAPPAGGGAQTGTGQGGAGGEAQGAANRGGAAMETQTHEVPQQGAVPPDPANPLPETVTPPPPQNPPRGNAG